MKGIPGEKFRTPDFSQQPVLGIKEKEIPRTGANPITGIDVFGTLPMFFERLLERANSVCSGTAKNKIALGIIRRWFNYFAAPFFKALGIHFSTLVHSLRQGSGNVFALRNGFSLALFCGPALHITSNVRCMQIYYNSYLIMALIR